MTQIDLMADNGRLRRVMNTIMTEAEIRAALLTAKDPAREHFLAFAKKARDAITQEVPG